MRGFEITETVSCGIPIVREGEPHIAVPAGCAVDVRLHYKLLDFIASLKSDTAKLQIGEKRDRQFTLQQPAANNLLLLCPFSGLQDHRALVRLYTAGGVGGKVYLTANVLEETRNARGHVSKRPSAFPPLGVQHFCDDEQLEKVRSGVDALDVLVVMGPGSNICIRRTGNLEGAQSVLSLRWNGAVMLIDGQPMPGLWKQHRFSGRSEPVHEPQPVHQEME